MKEIIHRLQLAVEEYKRMNNVPHYVFKANQPATDAEIAELEEHLKLPLPPSYREFLELHNGYKGLACPGSMLSIEDMMNSSIATKILEWKKDTSEYSGEDISHVLVFADQAQPNDWAYFEPKKTNENGEWQVVLNLGGDPFEFNNLSDFLESRIRFCNFRPEASGDL